MSTEAQKRRNRRWTAKNPGHHWNWHLKTHYGIDANDYEELLKRQNGLCAICGRPRGKYRLSVDHCHECKKIRGLLCHICNRGLRWDKYPRKLLAYIVNSGCCHGKD